MTSPEAPAGQHTVRRHNLRLVLLELRRSPGSRAELAQRTGLTKATVSSLVDSLVAQRILHEGDPENSGPGRPSRSLRFNPAGPVAVGVEINVDYTAVCAVDLNGTVRSHRHVVTDNRRLPADQVVARAADLVPQVQAELGQPVLGVGLAVPGAVGPEGVLLRAPNLPRLTGEQPGRALAAALGLPDVLVENEANLGALARLWSAPAGGQDFVYVSGEVGVGAGLVVGGELFRGVNGFAGELGHVVVERDGPRCSCGGRGCVEQYAGQEVVLRNARQPDLDSLQVALESGDRAAVAATDQAGSALGVGLSSLLNVFDVPVVVLGGMYARLFDAITPALTGELERRVLSSRLSGGQIRRSSLGIDAAVHGAAGLVIDRALKHPNRLTADLTASVENSDSSSPLRTRRIG
jgi:predicted NBD/HSP70 family sugar kinase